MIHYSALNDLRDLDCEQVIVLSGDHSQVLYSLVPIDFKNFNLDWSQLESTTSVTFNDKKYFVVHKDDGKIKAKSGPTILVITKLNQATAFFVESKDREPVINPVFEKICGAWRT